MSELSEEDMAKVMKLGTRVVRGRDWPTNGNEDGNGPGTIIDEYPDDNWWVVDWDNQETEEVHYYCITDGRYDLRIFGEKIIKSGAENSLGSKLSSAKEFSDLKIICNGKTFECHKIVMSCQSDVFKGMFLYSDSTESKSGEITINDFLAETMETFLHYIYNQEVKEKLINTDLLLIADKYDVLGLVKICNEHLKSTLSVKNCLDILFAIYGVPDQDKLFCAVSEFVIQNKGKIMETTLWKDMKKTNPKLIAEILSNVLSLQF